MGRYITGRIPLALCIVLGLAIVLVAGCNNTVRNGTDTQALESLTIEKGATTLQELVDRLGPPSATTSNGDGTQLLTWSGVTGQVHNAGSVALAAFAPDAVNVKQGMHTCSLQVTVKDGVVIDFSRTSGDQHFVNYQ